MSAPVFPCSSLRKEKRRKTTKYFRRKDYESLEYANSSDTQNGGKTLAVDCTQTANTEFYIDLGKECDIYTGAGFSDKTPENFYKKSAVEFRIKLNDTPASFFNIYLFQSRGEKYASAPANQRYIRSNVQLKTYVDATIIGEWQYVQVPFTAFSSNGEYVNENNVKVKDTPVNLAKVCAIGFAHRMTDADTKITPTIQYDDLKTIWTTKISALPLFPRRITNSGKNRLYLQRSISETLLPRAITAAAVSAGRDRARTTSLRDSIKTKKFTKPYTFMQDSVNNGAIDRN